MLRNATLTAGAALSLLIFLTLTCLPGSATSLSAQDATAPSGSVKPGINAPFLNPDLNVGEFVDKFEVESREVFAARQAIVDSVALKPGDRIADIGAGTGLFVTPFAEAVGPTGRVFAIDIVPAFLQRIGDVMRASKLTNVTPVLSGEDNIRMPRASVDVAFLCDVYHHFEYPAASLASIHDAIRPGGSLVVIDFERIPGVSRDWLLDHVRADKQTFAQEIQDAGFELIGEASIDGFQENYFLRFERR